MLMVNTISELLKYTYRNVDAYLEVIGNQGRLVWKEMNGAIQLNIRNKAFPIISEECFEKIQNKLIMSGGKHENRNY